MTFPEYEELHERCELYKSKAVKAILAIIGNACDDVQAIPQQCYLYQCSDTELSYHIHLADGFNVEGKLRIDVLDLYLSGKKAEAKLKYKEIR